MTRRPSLVLAILLLAACGPSVASPIPASPTPAAPSQSAGPAASDDPAAREAGWIGDLEAIVPALERVHPDPFHGVSREAVSAAVDALKATVPTASDEELLVGIMELMAMLGAEGREGHTGAFVWGTGTYATHTLPLRLWSFPEGSAVVADLPPYEELVGKVIATLDGRPFEAVVAALEPLMPRDNDATLTLLAPRFLLTTEILLGAGLIDDGTHVELSFTDAPESLVEVTAIPTADYNEWATPYGLHLPTRPDVPWLARSEEPIWTRADDGGATLYIQYNRVTRLGASALEPITTAIADPAVRRVIVDIRHNFGGETDGYLPIAEALAAGAAAWPDGLFVMTGRNTFSAATLFAADLAARTEVTIVGEPMGGSPTLYGDTEEVTLPWSGIALTVATGYYEVVEGDTRIDLPVDLPVSLTLADYLAGRDPALEAIEASGP